ncbi:MAG: hypothetical protein RI948_1461, partial [Bacteroidota bacterium]
MRWIGFVVIAAFFVSCKKDATRWQTEWLLPVLNDTLSLAHYYNDSTLSINGSQIDINL